MASEKDPENHNAGEHHRNAAHRNPVGQVRQTSHAVQRGRETHPREKHRGHVQVRAGRLLEIADQQQAHDQGKRHQRQHEDEDPAPAQRVQHQTRKCRAQRRGHRDDHRDQAKDPAAALQWNQPHDRRHEQRNHQRGAGSLNDAGGEQHREDRSHNGEHRAREEEQHRCGVHLPQAEALHDVAGHRDHHSHRQHEAGDQPLRDVRADLEVIHQHRQRDRESGLIEDDHEGCGDKHADQELRVGCGCVGVVCAAVIGAGSYGFPLLF